MITVVFLQQPCSQSDSMTELDLLRDQLAKSELLRKQEQANAGVSAKEAADLKKALTSAQQKELAATQVGNPQAGTKSIVSQ